MKTMTQEDLQRAREGSWYTILGAGGDLEEWVSGYEDLMAKEGIGKPVQWYFCQGSNLNQYMKPTEERDRFPGDLGVLMFPLDGLHVGKLALFKLGMQDRWFDDVVGNTRSRALL